MRKLLLIISLFFSKLIMATTFTVVSPLDNGAVGTLRWAIEQANGNSPAAGMDLINFNIPSGNPVARVIQLNSELPFLTSNITIDGTTQPMGAAYGASDAKIIITPKNFLSCKRGLIIRDADHIEIYGLYLAGFISKTPQVAEVWSDGIFMCNVNNVIIGAPGKGNAFTLNYHSIRCDAFAESGNPLPGGGINGNIIIQNNIIGKNYTGQAAPIDGVVAGVELRYVHDVRVGGYAAGESNQLMVFTLAVGLFLKSNGVPSTIDIINNNFIIGTSTVPIPFQLTIVGIDIDNSQPANPDDHLVNISGDTITQYVVGINLQHLKRHFNIARSIIDADRTRTFYTNSIGINAFLCDSGMIGGFDSANIIKNCKTFGISTSLSKYIEISRNSIFCTPKGISIVSPAVIIPTITDMTFTPALAVNGKTCVGCRVEIFNTTQCLSEVYNGETLAGVRFGDANGDWTFSGPVDCNTTYTVTNTDHTTSEFTTAMSYIIDTTAAIKQDATCNQNNGFIKGIKIFAGVDFHWEDNLGNIINTVDTNLLNLAPGFYKLVCTKQTLGCRLSTHLFEIQNVIPVINTAAMQLIHPSPDCRVKGSITNISISSPASGSFSYRWVNQLGLPVATTLDLTNVPAGTYTLTVYVSFDPTCTASVGPFTLIDKPGPKFDLAALRINNATCGHANGNIAGIAITNAYASQQFKWYDQRGNIVGTSISLSNVAPGNYYLVYDDASPCPAMTSPVFTVGNSGMVTIDAGNVLIQPSGCTIIKGSIKNISVTGANVYEWVNTVNGVSVGNNLDLGPVPDGNYKLRAFDTNNGCSDSTQEFIVPITTIQNLIVQSKTVVDETCTRSNGSISNIVFQSSTAGYNFKWIRPLQDTFSMTLNITNLKANDFTLIAYDSNGCVQTVMQQSVIDHTAPQLNESNVTIANDTCTQNFGSISNISFTNGTVPMTYLWLHSPLNSIAGNSNNLVGIGSGAYYLILKDVNGCADTSSIFTVGDESPLIIPPLYDDVYAKRNTAAFIQPLIAGSGIFELYDTPLSAIPLQTNTTGKFKTIPLAVDRNYWIRKIVGSCNSAKVKVHVYMIDQSKVFVPNAFTPNNDGLNDVLRIKVYGNIVIDHFSIYNRWGQQVFLGGNIKNSWDGTTNGNQQPAGTYAWIIQGYDIDGTPLNLKGTVTLLK